MSLADPLDQGDILGQGGDVAGTHVAEGGAHHPTGRQGRTGAHVERGADRLVVVALHQPQAVRDAAVAATAGVGAVAGLDEPRRHGAVVAHPQYGVGCLDLVVQAPVVGHRSGVPATADVVPVVADEPAGGG